ncbi:MAG: hypothetical protein ABIK09_04230 [Pseudomonadota bacterium]
MKKMLVLCVMAAFLAVGCGGEKKDEAKMDEAKMDEAKKDEVKKDEAEPVEEKAPEAPAAEGGEALWTQSCDHATKLILASPELKEMPDEAKADMAKNMPLECLAELKRAGGAAADASALCMLGLTEFSPESFGKCEPKMEGGEEAAPEATEEAKEAPTEVKAVEAPAE